MRSFTSRRLRPRERFARIIALHAGLALAFAASSGTLVRAADISGSTVAFLMPDQGSTRYEEHDHPGFVAEMKKVCESCKVIYLNADWPSDAGGELVIYDEHSVPRLTLAPDGGTLVLFLSDETPHEAMKATRERWSIAGWFRTR